PPTGISPLSLHDALPISAVLEAADENLVTALIEDEVDLAAVEEVPGLLDPTTMGKWEVVRQIFRLRSWRVVAFGVGLTQIMQNGDRKSTRLNSSHRTISY